LGPALWPVRSAGGAWLFISRIYGDGSGREKDDCMKLITIYLAFEIYE